MVLPRHTNSPSPMRKLMSCKRCHRAGATFECLAHFLETDFHEKRSGGGFEYSVGTLADCTDKCSAANPRRGQAIMAKRRIESCNFAHPLPAETGSLCCEWCLGCPRARRFFVLRLVSCRSSCCVYSFPVLLRVFSCCSFDFFTLLCRAVTASIRLLPMGAQATDNNAKERFPARERSGPKRHAPAKPRRSGRSYIARQRGKRRFETAYLFNLPRG
jgi:hypothetical protein